MVPLWITGVFLALVTFYVSQDLPRKEAAQAAAVADVSATNLLAYRKAVQAFLSANPTATGTIDDTALAVHWLPGYVRRPEWTNLVASGTVFVYSTSVMSNGTVFSLREKSGESLLVGTKNTSTGRLQSATGVDTGINLPAAIPGGAVVMMGR